MPTQTPLWPRVYVTAGVAIVVSTILFVLLHLLVVAEETAADWTPVAAMQDGTASVRAVIDDSTLYLVGGETKGGATNQIFSGRIDAGGSINILATVEPSLPVSIYLHTAVNYGHHLYVIGGWDGSRRYSTVWWNVLPLIPVRSWSPNTTYPRKIVLHEAVVVGDALYVIGGVDENNVPLSEVQSTRVDPSNGILTGWHLTRSMPKALFRHSVATYDNYIYVTGGYDGRQASDEIYYAKTDGQDNILEWNLSSLRLPQPLYYHQSFIRDGKLWIIGGKSGDTEFNTVASTPIDPDYNLKGQWLFEVKLPVSTYRFSAIPLERCPRYFIFSIGGLHENIYQSQIYQIANMSKLCSYFPVISVQP